MNQLLKAKVTGPLVERFLTELRHSRYLFCRREPPAMLMYVSFFGCRSIGRCGITISFCGGARIVVEGRGVRTYSCLSHLLLKILSHRAPTSKGHNETNGMSIYAVEEVLLNHLVFLRLKSDWWRYTKYYFVRKLLKWRCSNKTLGITHRLKCGKVEFGPIILVFDYFATALLALNPNSRWSGESFKSRVVKCISKQFSANMRPAVEVRSVSLMPIQLIWSAITNYDLWRSAYATKVWISSIYYPFPQVNNQHMNLCLF